MRKGSPMMSNRRYEHVAVCAEKGDGCSRLLYYVCKRCSSAAVPDDAHVPHFPLQIAREFNFSETTFVFEPTLPNFTKKVSTPAARPGVTSRVLGACVSQVCVGFVDTCQTRGQQHLYRFEYTLPTSRSHLRGTRTLELRSPLPHRGYWTT